VAFCTSNCFVRSLLLLRLHKYLRTECFRSASARTKFSKSIKRKLLFCSRHCQPQDSARPTQLKSRPIKQFPPFFGLIPNAPTWFSSSRSRETHKISEFLDFAHCNYKKTQNPSDCTGNLSLSVPPPHDNDSNKEWGGGTARSACSQGGVSL
jgi:hypothetical protein